jgi:hypothetical protein
VIEIKSLAAISPKNEIVAFASNRMLAIVEICYSTYSNHSDSEEETQ